MTVPCRESASALPLLVFHSGHSHGLYRDTKERFNFILNLYLADEWRSKHATLLSSAEGVNVRVTGVGEGEVVMTLKDWFYEQSVEDDINEIHSIYRAVADDDSSWGYEVRKHSSGRYSITDSHGNKASYSKSERKCLDRKSVV